MEINAIDVHTYVNYFSHQSVCSLKIIFKARLFKRFIFQIFNIFFIILFRRGIVGLPSRLTNKGRAGSVQAGTDDGSLQDESSLDGEDSEKQ